MYMKRTYLLTIILLIGWGTTKAQLTLQSNKFKVDTIKFNGDTQQFTVPAGVKWLFVRCAGASGGSGALGGNNVSGGAPGKGSYIEGILNVTPGQVLNVFVGGQGATPAGGFNGGGKGGSVNAGGGGGATDIRIGGTSEADRVLIAAGGGGGGRGGCHEGSSFGGVGGAGGNGGSGVGVDGVNSAQGTGVAGGGLGGNAGSVQGKGGIKGVGCSCCLGTDGATVSAGTGGDGGNGQSCCCTSQPSIPGGGGGGGGLIGGGGGGGGSAGTSGCAGNSKGAGGGGGGGSNLLSGLVTNSFVTVASGTGNGYVIIYTPQCDGNASIGVFPSKKTVCFGDSVTFTASPDIALATPTNSTSTSKGHMFDVLADTDIVINGFDIIPESQGKFQVYTKLGTYEGFENTAASWTLIDSFSLNASSTPVPLKLNSKIDKGTIRAFYIHSPNSAFSQSKSEFDNQLISANTDLRVFAGKSVNLKFGSNTASRYFAGQIHYKLQNTKITWSGSSSTTETIRIPMTNSVFTSASFSACKTVRDSTKIRINPLPIVKIVGPNLVLISSNASSYQWYYNDTKMVNDTNNFIVPVKDGQYKVRVTNVFGCEATSDPFIVTWVDVKDIENNSKIKIVPNPATNGSVDIQFSKEIKYLEIYDVTGKRVYNSNHAGVIELTKWANGVYTVMITDKKGKSYISRFIVQ